MNLNDCFEEGLLKKEKPSIEKSNSSLQTAEIYILKANNTFKSSDFDLTIFCSYTSMFHSARSLLFKDGIKERSHICVIEYVKQKYSALKDEMHLMDSYRRSRHATIYALDIITTEEQAKEAINDAQNTLKKIRQIINAAVDKK